MTDTTAADRRAGTLPSRVRWLCVFHVPIALALLVAVPPTFKELLRDRFFSPSSMWLRQGELYGWVGSALDELLAATPYWASYEPGWFMGLFPGVLAASAAWEMRKRRASGRYLAIGLHGLVAVVALSVIAWLVYHFLAPRWAPPGGQRTGGHDSLAGLIVIVYACVGLAALAGLFVSGSLLWWLCRPATRNCFTTQRGPRTRTLWACCLGVLLGLLVPELVWNRVAVYRGEASFQGKSTGAWLGLLASRDAATRRAAVEKLAEAPDSAPVLREMFRDKPGRPDEVRRIASQAGRPRYWSRACTTPEWKQLTEVWRSLGSP